MKLRLNNVAKIKEATIHVNGITVIAGENNTGKSTIGKVLYSVFRSMSNMENKIADEKRKQLERVSQHLVQSTSVHNGLLNLEYYNEIEKLVDEISKISLPEDMEYLEQIVRKHFQKTKVWNGFNKDEEMIKDYVVKLENIIKFSDEKLVKVVVTRWFNRMFEKQISPLTDQNLRSRIELSLKEKSVDFSFQNNSCVDWKTELYISQEAFLIDNPFVMNYMNSAFLKQELRPEEHHLLECLCKKEDIYDNIFETVTAKEKLEEIDNIFAGIVEGDFVEMQTGEYALSSKKFSKPIHIKNLSTGLKSFALIKRLLENGSLKEKDVLILDEPEIHLHPEWQLAYAEVIVLLQKKFDLSIVITTHSPYFLDAIDVFSAKYKMSDKVNYYMSECVEDISYLRDVTNDIDIIYKKLSEPLQKLENLRSGLI